MDYCICKHSLYGYPEKKILNGKEQFIRKKIKSFYQKVYNNLHTYREQFHTKFGSILNSLSGMLGGSIGILHNREIF